MLQMTARKEKKTQQEQKKTKKYFVITDSW